MDTLAQADVMVSKVMAFEKFLPSGAGGGPTNGQNFYSRLTFAAFFAGNGSINNLAGTLTDGYFNCFEAVLPTGDFSIASLQFSAKAGGNSAVLMSDSPSFPFANDLAEVMPVSFQGAASEVSAVPEPGPASLALLPPGLLGPGMAVAARRLNLTAPGRAAPSGSG